MLEQEQWLGAKLCADHLVRVVDNPEDIQDDLRKEWRWDVQ